MVVGGRGELLIFFFSVAVARIRMTFELLRKSAPDDSPPKLLAHWPRQ